MSGPNIDVSNGTCYTAAGQKLDGSFIPCGNDAFGYQTCCGAGDNCLADLACFGIHGSGYGSYLTYFAGCTDPNYKDGSCPNKEVDQPWVALTLCDNSGGAWAICSQQGNPSTLQPGSYCSCTNSASATVAFKDSTSLANIASLPQSTGQSISFFADHSPSGSPTAAPSSESSSSPATQSSTAGSSSSGVAPSTSSTTKPTPSSGHSSSQASGSSSGTSSSPTSGGSGAATSSNGQSGSSAAQSGSSGGQGGSSSNIGTGAIVGIAIGAIAAVLLFLLLAFLLLRRRRRRSAFEPGIGAKLSKQRESDMSTAASSAPGGLGRPTTPSMAEADGLPVSEVAGKPATPWKLRSELDGKQVFPVFPGRRKTRLGNVPGERSRKESDALPPLAELPGSEPKREGAPGTGPIEDAMVAPLRLRPKDEGAGRVQLSDGAVKSTHGPKGGSPVEASQAAPQDGGLAVVGPDGARFPGEQDTSQAQETEHRPWGWRWRGIIGSQKSNDEND